MSSQILFIAVAIVCAYLIGSLELIAYSTGILLLPMIKYIPRIKEMRVTGGSWRHVALRKNLRDRL